MQTEIINGGILLVLILASIFGGIFMVQKGSRKINMLYLFNSKTPQMQLNLYFGMVGIYSLFIYTCYSTIVGHISFDITSLSKGISIIFLGIGAGSVGNGIQSKVDPSTPTVTVDPTTYQIPILSSSVFTDIYNATNTSVQIHLVLGAISIIGMILYQWYNIIFGDQTFVPIGYATAITYALAAIGVAGIGQSFQRSTQPTTTTP